MFMFYWFDDGIAIRGAGEAEEIGVTFTNIATVRKGRVKDYEIKSTYADTAIIVSVMEDYASMIQKELDKGSFETPYTGEYYKQRVLNIARSFKEQIEYTEKKASLKNEEDIGEDAFILGNRYRQKVTDHFKEREKKCKEEARKMKYLREVPSEPWYFLGKGDDMIQLKKGDIVDIRVKDDVEKSKTKINTYKVIFIPKHKRFITCNLLIDDKETTINTTFKESDLKGNIVWGGKKVNDATSH